MAEFFVLDSGWVRVPTSGSRRRDGTGALVLFAISALALEMLRSGGGLRAGTPVWEEYLGLAAMSAPIAFRRRFPIGTVVASSVAFFVVGIRMPDVALQLSVQALYFFALFSAMAWARDRRVVLLVMGGVLLMMFGWLAYQFLLGSAVSQITEEIADPGRTRGAVNPILGAVAYTFLVNIAYFGGAVLGGQAAWNAARRRARLAAQAETLRAQAAELKEHAVVEERRAGCSTSTRRLRPPPSPPSSRRPARLSLRCARCSAPCVRASASPPSPTARRNPRWTPSPASSTRSGARVST